MVLDKAYGGMRRALCAVLALAVALSCMMLPQAAMAADTGVTNAKVVLRKSDTVNVYELLRFKKLLFTKDALDAFIKRLA